MSRKALICPTAACLQCRNAIAINAIQHTPPVPPVNHDPHAWIMRLICWAQLVLSGIAWLDRHVNAR